MAQVLTLEKPKEVSQGAGECVVSSRDICKEAAILSPLFRKSTVESTEDVLMKTCDEGIVLQGTDLSCHIQTLVPAKTAKAFTAQISGKRFAEILQTVDQEQELRIKQLPDNRLAMICGNARFAVACKDAETFPRDFDSALGPSEKRRGGLPSESLIAALRHTVFALEDPGVSSPGGLLLEIGEGVLQTVASNGHRLAFYSTNVDAAKEAHGAFVLDNRGVATALRAMRGAVEQINVDGSGKGFVRFDSGSRVISVRKVEASFPNYQKFFEAEYPSRITLGCGDLRRALEHTSLFLEKGAGVRLTVKPGKIILSGKNEIEEAWDSIPAELSGPEGTLVVNPAYVAEYLQVISTDRVELQLHMGAPRPVLMKALQEGYGSRYLVMPLHDATQRPESSGSMP